MIPYFGKTRILINQPQFGMIYYDLAVSICRLFHYNLDMG